MSVHVTDWVWRFSLASGNSLTVALALADNAGDDGRCFPGQDYLTRKTRLSESTVRRALRELEAHGELATETHSGPRGDGPRRVNVYRLTMPTDRVDRLPRRSPDQAGQTDRLAIVKPVRSAGQAGQIDRASRSAVTGRTVKNHQEPARARNDECPRHRGQLLRSCSGCRSEQIAAC